jgi:hypothetical protein
MTWKSPFAHNNFFPCIFFLPVSFSSFRGTFEYPFWQNMSQLSMTKRKTVFYAIGPNSQAPLKSTSILSFYFSFGSYFLCHFHFDVHFSSGLPPFV